MQRSAGVRCQGLRKPYVISIKSQLLSTSGLKGEAGTCSSLARLKFYGY
jgi:hypothetical protein